MNSPIDDSGRSGQAEPFSKNPQEFCWIARKLHPAILLQVLLVFAAFMAVSQFVFQSSGAVKSLALAAIAAIISLLPQALARFEYRADEAGVERRSISRKKGQAFGKVFSWEELSHMVPTRQGFKYFLRLDESSRLKRFFKMNISDKYSGEIHVEAKDRNRIRDLLANKDVPVRTRRKIE